MKNAHTQTILLLIFSLHLVVGWESVAAGHFLNAPRGTSFVDDMSAAEAARYEQYWQRYSPQQVSPGTRRLDFERVSGRTGRTETSRVIYDEHGRQIYRVDHTDHLRPEAHSNPHLHEYEYGPGYDPHRELLHNLDGR